MLSRSMVALIPTVLELRRLTAPCHLLRFLDLVHRHLTRQIISLCPQETKGCCETRQGSTEAEPHVGANPIRFSVHHPEIYLGLFVTLRSRFLVPPFGLCVVLE